MADITDNDLDYLRNIDTSPGPNAGRSIDPTKPGPDADRTKRLRHKIADELEAGLEAGRAKPDADRIAEEVARVRHVKRGSTYRVIGKAQVQCEKDDPLTDYEVVVVYRCEQDGEIWVRRVSEFEDGRFEKLPAALRRYAGDGVTDEQVEAGCKAWSGTWGHDFPGKLTGSDIHDHAADCMRHTMRAALEAAARANPSEKGGAI